uniref:Cadherin Y-type LIR-motif domain-containing protein n=1 Tax=Timema douglasi TaxID=61478 RepID=A0A7R8ZBW9_TIMDO|nr:unnamed protein product [Timema douglasi]
MGGSLLIRDMLQNCLYPTTVPRLAMGGSLLIRDMLQNCLHPPTVPRLAMGGSLLIRDMLQNCLHCPTTGDGREPLDKRHVTELPSPSHLLSTSSLGYVFLMVVTPSSRSLFYYTSTDENDLNFDDLSNFGPRFRKLADMYGEDPSEEEEEENFHNAASESWC